LLLGCGIELHVQIVLVPGVNDGEVLQRTLAWLAEREGIVSVGVVPLGYTKAQSRFARSYEDAASATEVLDALALWQEGMLKERDVRWVYAADEFYLAAGRALPSWDEYDGFPQFENGIGLARAFLDEFDQAVAEADGATPAGEGAPRVTLVTGELFAPVMNGIARRMGSLGVYADVLPVRNALFGGNVTVAGLLGGEDIAAAIASAPADGTFLVPDVVVNSDGLLLDDVPAAELSARTGRDVRIVPTDAAGLVAEVQRIGS
jgi:NifB/MoaA-like Fe-S oxidoreductase